MNNNLDLTRFFQLVPRGNGDVVWSLTDDRPEWLADAVREAHDGEFPDDWRYDTCHGIFSMLDAEDDPFDDDLAHEIADQLVDTYNYDRLKWLSDDMTRIAYCDEAQEDGLTDNHMGVFEAIGAGQYICIRRMVETLQEAMLEARQDDDAHFQCSECSKVGTCEDLCGHEDDCPDEDCIGVCYWVGD